MRSILIPGFDIIKAECRSAPALLGGGISGSGPSIFMLSRDEQTAHIVAAVMKSVYDKDRRELSHLCNNSQSYRSDNA